MTQAEAEKIAAKLFAAFPYPVREMTTAVYVERLMPLPRPDLALQAVDALISNEDRLPPVAALLREYQVIAKRDGDAKRQRALMAPGPTPDEIAENLRMANEMLEKIGKPI